MATCTVQLVTWNGAKYLPFLFKSLKQQTYADWDIIITDNASTDDTVMILEKELKTLKQSSRLIKNSTNTGFAKAHNQAFNESTSEYVALLNQDMYLDSDCFKKLIEALGQRPAAAGVTPRLMSWNFNRSISGKLEDGFTNIIDSLGLQVLRNRRVIERRAGESWQVGSNKGVEEVFGVSGALPVFRRSSVEAVLLPANRVFDSLYVAYKEDVDLAFRLRASGFCSYVVPSALAYHDRTAKHAAKLDDLAAAIGKRTQSDYVAYHSYKNHLATLYKNEYWQNLILDFPWVLWYETKKFVYFLLFKPGILKAWLELFGNRRTFSKARQAITKSRKASASQLRKWFV